MKKEAATHLIFFVATFLLISLLRRYFSLNYVFFWAGGFLGTLLPDLDHLIYVYYLRPQELTSQRTQYLIAKNEFWRTLSLLAATRNERKQLIFHSAFFQVVFLVLAFFALTSSGSLLGRGLVLAFLLHLLVDQMLDFFTLDHLDNWFNQFNFSLSREKALFYWLAMIGTFAFFAFLL